MNIENFAEWQRRQGHLVIKSQSSYWHMAGPRVLQAFPYDRLIEPSESELRQVMLRYRILSLRYSTPIEAASGKVSYHVILSNPYNLELLRSQARNAVKRGLAACKVEIISFERLAEEGWNLQYDTLERQGRSKSMNKSEWQRICLSTSGLPGFEVWAAIVDEDLAAALITTRIDDVCFVPYALSHRQFLSQYVNNALFFSASCNMLAKEGVSHIFFTVQSLDAPQSVDEFKFRMGLKAIPVRQRVIFHPFLQFLIHRSSHKMVRWLSNRYPGSNTFAKTEGMMRFYLQGKLPLYKQDWPECLVDSVSKPTETSVS
jgi:hypothetical protein